MKATGVIRRIDELGRIVIPKELRKNMRLKDGENLEIYTVDNEKIVLKKFSNLKNISDLAIYITEAISKELKKTCIITDNDEIISCSGKEKKDYLNKSLSDIDFSYFIKKDILVNGDKIGNIAIKTNSLDDNKILNIFNYFLEKYLD